MRRRKNFIALAGIFGLLAVAIGAFGAHGLKPLLAPDRIAIFETGVQYHFYHSLALLALGILALQQPSRYLHIAGWCFALGIILFSGSLYLLACRHILGIEHWFWLGPLTPIGGMAFIIGWGLIFLDQIKKT